MADLRRALVFGGTGQLGSQILRLWEGIDVVAPSRSQVDVEDPRAVNDAIARTKADVVLNCTAYNDVPRAEREPEPAFALNATTVGELARTSEKFGSSFVTFSTDYVFDGRLRRPYTEEDAPNPVSAYGRSKLAGEREALQYPRAYVVRTCGLYGTGASTSKGYTFIQKIIERARSGEPLRIVSDQTLSPTFAGHLALAVRTLIEREAPPGLYHAVNEGAVTWHGFAVEALRQAGISAHVAAISSAEFAAGVERPAYSVLENARLHALGISMPSWQEGIAAYLSAIRA